MSQAPQRPYPSITSQTPEALRRPGGLTSPYIVPNREMGQTRKYGTPITADLSTKPQ